MLGGSERGMDGHNSVLHCFGWVQRDRAECPHGCPDGFGQALDTIREHGKLAFFIGQQNLNCENVKPVLRRCRHFHIRLIKFSCYWRLAGTIAGGYKNEFFAQREAQSLI